MQGTINTWLPQPFRSKACSKLNEQNAHEEQDSIPKYHRGCVKRLASSICLMIVMMLHSGPSTKTQPTST